MKIKATIEFDVPEIPDDSVYWFTPGENWIPEPGRQITKSFVKEVITNYLTHEFHGICEKVKVTVIAIK